MLLSVIAFTISCNSGFAANQLDDGFYLQERSKPAELILSHDGQKVFIGAKQSLKISQSWLSSQNNENSKFYLSVTIPFNMEIGPSTYILMVDGKAYRQTGSGSSQKKTSSLNFYISGVENAEQVSEFVKTPVAYRRHPRHNLLVSFTPAKKEFSVGDDVDVILKIKNVGTNSISFKKGGRNRAVRDNQYIFSARLGGKQVEDIGTSYHFGGIAVRRALKPNEVFEDSISLNSWFAFDKAGMYKMHGAYYLDFNDPDTESYITIWDAYVSADFIIRIKGEKEASNRKGTKDKK